MSLQTPMKPTESHCCALHEIATKPRQGRSSGAIPTCVAHLSCQPAHSRVPWDLKPHMGRHSSMSIAVPRRNCQLPGPTHACQHMQRKPHVHMDTYGCGQSAHSTMAIKVCAHHGAPIEGALGTLENAPHLAEVVFEVILAILVVNSDKVSPV